MVKNLVVVRSDLEKLCFFALVIIINLIKKEKIFIENKNVT